MPLTLRVLAAALTRPPRHRYGPDPSQVADLHVPDGEGPFPVVVLLHGGYWQTRYGKLVMRPVARDLVARGFAVWNLEYRRLGTGRGGGGGWPQTFEDVGDGIDALAELGDERLDLGDVSVVGHSAGGHLALWAGGRRDARVPVRRVAALAALTDLSHAGRVVRVLMGGSADEVPERYAEADPIRRAPLDVPVLLVHAVDDRSVPIRRSRDYAAKARSAGAQVEVVEVAAGGHRTPIDPPSQAWRATAGWLGVR